MQTLPTALAQSALLIHVRVLPSATLTALDAPRPPHYKLRSSGASLEANASACLDNTAWGSVLLTFHAFLHRDKQYW